MCQSVIYVEYIKAPMPYFILHWQKALVIRFWRDLHPACQSSRHKAAQRRKDAGNAALLVDPYSVDFLSEAMLNITEQPTLREQMIQKGSDQVKNSPGKIALKKP